MKKHLLQQVFPSGGGLRLRERMKRLDFVFFDAGGGHRSAATALKTVIEQQKRAWDVRLLNLQEVLEPLDVFRRLTGIRMQEIYNRMLASGLTLGSEYMVPIMQAVIRMYHSSQVRMLADFWRRDTPDLVVSVVPNFNRALFEGLRFVNDSTPFVTILTDFADYPPHFWMERQDQFIVCGTAKAAEQARAVGYSPDKIFSTSGMILRPSFYQSFQHDVRTERAKLGLHPDLPTGLVLFGGHGSPVMHDIGQRVQRIERDLQLIMMCGRNQKLAAKLRGMHGRHLLHVVEFTNDVPYYMSVCDFFIGKPGPGSISEALSMKLPVILECNAWTLPQERYNAEWVQEQQVGVVVSSFRKIAEASAQLLDPTRFQRFRCNASALRNRAVYEIPDILAKILKQNA